MIIVIGGGPAGFFGAITARRANPSQKVVLLEKNASALAKVKVSGGGRCNVTHACFAPRDLAGHYPRGRKELIGPFTKWGPAETVAWFAGRGVELKTEPDGRMFPVTDSSGTIVDCLTRAAREAGVEIRTNCMVEGVGPAASGTGFTVRLAGGESLTCDKLLLATGGRTSGKSSPGDTKTADGYSLAQELGHTIAEPVPSLFTLRIDDPLLAGLAGVSVPEAGIRLADETGGGKALRQTGPVLVTHRGLSGPAVLRMSAWGARHLHDLSYRFGIAVNWCPHLSTNDLDSALQDFSRRNGKQQVSTGGPVELPRRLWAALVARAGIDEATRWGDLDRGGRTRLVAAVVATELEVTGKDTFKEEFVTCGGVPLRQVDFKTMSSRLQPGLFFAGELLDIDGLTGGFNFQSCWTTGYLAGRGLAKLKVLFLCTGNSCRSQMAEGWARTLLADSVEAWSAGVETHGLNQRAVQVMAEAGVDISAHRSQLVDDLRHIPFDFVVTVCDNARESCPVFPGGGKVVHHGFEDPPLLAESARSEEEILAPYRRVRDEIRDFVADFHQFIPK
ncbi:MAG: aminoacetone oxidase family FAD-binding enzyme [Candidatus Krumholzibacteriota bacterium]